MSADIQTKRQKQNAARRYYQSLDEVALAHQLVRLAEMPRGVSPIERYAILYTAAARLRGSEQTHLTNDERSAIAATLAAVK